jgi:hypothetical protein
MFADVLWRATAMFRLLTVLAVFALATGCGGETADRLPDFPDQPDQLVLFSIDGPTYNKTEGELPEHLAKGELFHHQPVLGKIEITDPEKRRAVVSAVKEAARTKPDLALKCFTPRHAIRFIKGGETVEMLICFQCGNYKTFLNGTQDRSGTRSISNSEEARTLLNKTLADAGVPLAAED